ncbi:hypothetical protein AAGL88_27075, partial [Klebsiella pneumoniae]
SAGRAATTGRTGAVFNLQPPGCRGSRFVLAKHSWDEPYQRLAAASEGRAWRLLTPVQGEPVWVADKTQSFNAWWR